MRDELDELDELEELDELNELDELEELDKELVLWGTEGTATANKVTCLQVVPRVKANLGVKTERMPEQSAIMSVN
jgi:hypothetical protein